MMEHSPEEAIEAPMVRHDGYSHIDRPYARERCVPCLTDELQRLREERDQAKEMLVGNALWVETRRENERLRAALERGFDHMEVEHFPWCALLDANAALGRNEPGCDCGRQALASHTGDTPEVNP